MKLTEDYRLAIKFFWANEKNDNYNLLNYAEHCMYDVLSRLIQIRI